MQFSISPVPVASLLLAPEYDPHAVKASLGGGVVQRVVALFPSSLLAAAAAAAAAVAAVAAVKAGVG